MILNYTENVSYVYHILSLNQHTFLDKYHNNASIHCKPLKTFEKLGFYMRLFNLFVWIMGVIGNAIGLYAAWKDESKYVRVILMKAFHAINLVTLNFMLWYPLLGFFAKYRQWKFWYGKALKHYLANILFPLSRIFLNLSFNIYVLFAFAQIVAILYPLYYRQHFTTHGIKFMILGCFVYLLILFLPTAWWFQVVKIDICDMDFPTFMLYPPNFLPHEISWQKNAWITYGLLREFLTKFLPVCIILIFNIWSLKYRKKLLKYKSNLKLSNQKRERVEMNSTLTVQPTVINVQVRVNHTIKTLTYDSRTTSLTDLIDAQELKIKLKWTEYNINKRMVLINMLEYFILLFPEPLYLIFIDLMKPHIISDHEELAFSICTLMEYMYVILTFYLNLLFNPGYREEVVSLLKKSVKHFKNRVETNKIFAMKQCSNR
ncbi:unnamed protein product [Gordionus sp. m RMFG-2023]